MNFLLHATVSLAAVANSSFEYVLLDALPDNPAVFARGNKVAPQTYTALLSGCAVAEPCRWELALQLLRGMEAADGVRPNAVHYNACLTALAHATGRNTKDEEQQAQVIENEK